jgi:hypothetical protein
MTKPWMALVGPEIEENLSLRYLASSLRRAGFDSRILAFNHEGQLTEVVDAILAAPSPPCVVGLSLAFQWRAPDFLALAMALRQRGYTGHITAGGHFATFASRDILHDFRELDTICRQESEETLCLLGRAVLAGTSFAGIDGISYRDHDGQVVENAHPSLPELSNLAWPDRSGEPADVFGHRIAPLVGSRGCYANCTFCCIAAWHEQALPGKRYRLRPIDDLADEMAMLHHDRGIEIFVFHDDNFFLPKRENNVERFNALADALEARDVRNFATIVKARPTDVKPEVFEILKRRLRCVRAYVGIETDSEQGLITLRRWAKPRHNHEAIDVLRKLPLFACFNVLLFDPDTTLESLEQNLDFMEATSDFPFNFGRTELYAGTPLLQRMQMEKRVSGDYLQWNYAMTSPACERVFRIASKVFHERNFAGHALANSMMGTRFEIEACRHFHADVYEPKWREWGVDLSRRLGANSVAVMREILAHVRREGASSAADLAISDTLRLAVARIDTDFKLEAQSLAATVHRSIGVGSSLTAPHDVVATPLQRPNLEAP